MASETSRTAPSPAYVEANRDVVRRVVAQLTGSGLVSQEGEIEAHEACRQAVKVRDFLNMEIPNIRDGGSLDDAFKRMRRSARDFVRAGGPNAEAFTDDPAYFAACLRAMRLTLEDVVSDLRGWDHA